MDVSRLTAILRECIGAVDEEQNPLPGSEIVDVWMRIALKPEKVHEHAAEMIDILREWPSESWGHQVPSLGQEINYLIAGAVVGDQQNALVLFAFGKLLGWWDILDPRTVGLDQDDELAQKMVGYGFLSIDGYRPAT